ncbi:MULTISPECIES: hypothetical protein [unclassified Rhodococcus (in: high G+C Gram-positive bacteria)]|uniref:hypothetical protein n=1 Tax=unclassified Rhodococcus (in: high G+C Gram-positive bacteria) TaxID=192944 RepID=UPI0011408275|nr:MULTISPECIES: hypothetical protein [unclassified Rhodococcus (in: high G+C Gram-positive bacteria)]
MFKSPSCSVSDAANYVPSLDISVHRTDLLLVPEVAGGSERQQSWVPGERKKIVTGQLPIVADDLSTLTMSFTADTEGSRSPPSESST